jgi:hypothetical protein
MHHLVDCHDLNWSLFIDLHHCHITNQKYRCLLCCCFDMFSVCFHHQYSWQSSGNCQGYYCRYYLDWLNLVSESQIRSGFLNNHFLLQLRLSSLVTFRKVFENFDFDSFRKCLELFQYFRYFSDFRLHLCFKNYFQILLSTIFWTFLFLSRTDHAIFIDLSKSPDHSTLPLSFLAHIHLDF